MDKLIAFEETVFARVAVFPVLFKTDHLYHDLINEVVVSLLQQVGAIGSGERVDFSNKGLPQP